MKGFVLGVVATLFALVATVYLYFATGMAPVAVSAPPMPFEKRLARLGLHSRMDKERPQPGTDTSGRGEPGGRCSHLHGALCGLPWSSR